MRQLVMAALVLAACGKHRDKAIEIDMRPPDVRGRAGPSGDAGAPVAPNPPTAPTDPADDVASLPATTGPGGVLPDGVVTVKVSGQALSVGDDTVGAFVQPPVAASEAMWIDATTDALVKAGGAGAVIVRGPADTPFELVEIAAGGAAGSGHTELALVARGPGGKPVALAACAPALTGTCQGESLANPEAKHFVLTLAPGGAGSIAPFGGAAPATALTSITPDAVAAAVRGFEPSAVAMVHVAAQPGATLGDLMRALPLPAGTLRLVIGGVPEVAPSADGGE